MQMLVCCLALLAPPDDRFFAWVAEPANVQTLGPSIGRKLSREELAAAAAGRPTLPFASATVGVRLDDVFQYPEQ